MGDILVSISCITYNHSEYIKDCLEGFLMQETNFNFEILIHDDASNDGTQDIIKEYQVRYPEIIKPIFQTENQYSKGQRGINIKYNFPRAQGKYIALCEGDDYWTDPFKLQKQVDFLEENKDYIVCSHFVRYYNEQNKSFNDDTHQASDYTIKDLTMSVPFQIVSVVFRNSFTNSLPTWFGSLPLGDWGLYLYLLQHGKAKKFKDFMAVYRIHSQGIWSGNKNIKNSLKLSTLSILKDKFSDNVNTLLQESFFKFFLIEFTNLIRNEQITDAIALYEKYKSELPESHLPLFEEISNILINQRNLIIEKQNLNLALLNSKSYKLGNRIVRMFRIIDVFSKK